MKPIPPDEITRLAAEIREDPERFREAFENKEEAERFLYYEDLLCGLLRQLKPRVGRLSLDIIAGYMAARNILFEAQARKILEEAENAREEAACDAAADRRENRRR